MFIHVVFSIQNNDVKESEIWEIELEEKILISTFQIQFPFLVIYKVVQIIRQNE